jgi:hypothetical protein
VYILNDKASTDRHRANEELEYGIIHSTNSEYIHVCVCTCISPFRFMIMFRNILPSDLETVGLVLGLDGMSKMFDLIPFPRIILATTILSYLMLSFQLA